MSDALDFLLGGNVPAAKFDKIGDCAAGYITVEPVVQQQRDYDSGKPLTWEDGTPRKQLKIIIDTGAVAGNGDGRHALYVKSKMYDAVSAAVAATGYRGPLAGAYLSVTYVDDGPVARVGMNPPKLYSAEFAPPAAESEPAGDDGSDVPGY